MVARFRGDRLAAAREDAGMTQADLALAIGVSAAQRIANWERGDEQPRPNFIPVLARALGVAPLELVDVDPGRRLVEDLVRAVRAGAGVLLLHRHGSASLSACVRPGRASTGTSRSCP